MLVKNHRKIMKIVGTLANDVMEGVNFPHFRKCALRDLTKVLQPPHPRVHCNWLLNTGASDELQVQIPN
ncbi:hypothetical protein TNCV_5093121 [Trichonephila clavipes]|nr:hypothetical protein TNCV_5093121 [Trichonephila clavipes]